MLVGWPPAAQSRLLGRATGRGSNHPETRGRVHRCMERDQEPHPLHSCRPLATPLPRRCPGLTLANQSCLFCVAWPVKIKAAKALGTQAPIKPLCSEVWAHVVHRAAFPWEERAPGFRKVGLQRRKDWKSSPGRKKGDSEEGVSWQEFMPEFLPKQRANLM
jgi:hypothetical protein